jgi:hypothetical protein
MATYDTPYKPLPDSGTLNKQTVKKSPRSADYWGEIRVNLKDLTAIKTEDGLTVIKLSGWKKEDKNGKTFLSLAVNRYVPEEQGGTIRQEAQSQAIPDDDIPF